MCRIENLYNFKYFALHRKFNLVFFAFSVRNFRSKWTINSVNACQSSIIFFLIFQNESTIFVVQFSSVSIREIIVNASFHYRHGLLIFANLPLFLAPRSFVKFSFFLLFK